MSDLFLRTLLPGFLLFQEINGRYDYDIDLTDQRTGIWPGTASDTEVKGHQYFQNCFLYAEPDRWNRAWLYLADSD